MRDGEVEAEFEDCDSYLTATITKWAKHWVFQLERGAETGRLHYQGYMALIKKSRLSSLAACLNEDLPGIHLSPCSTAGESALKTYCMKADTRVKGPWADKELLAADAEAKKEWRQDTDFDFNKEYGMIENDPRPFQEELTRICQSEPNRRTILWISDPEGNSGKSYWASWVSDKFGAEYHTYAKTNDLMNVLANRPASRVYIFNLPRSKPKEQALSDLFNCMEQLKDGRILNYKYNGAVKRINTPHVVVLANYLPTIDEAKGLSNDRWSFKRICHRDWTLKAAPLKEHVTLESDPNQRVLVLD